MQPFSTDHALTDVTVKPGLAEPDDKALADRVLRGRDEGAFRALYRRHTPRLFQFVLRLLGGNELDAEDTVQDTWIKAAENLEQFRWESSLHTWLTGIALNRCRQQFRRQDRNWLAIREDLGVASRNDRPHERIDLDAALQGLPPGYRTVVVLHDVEGYTHKEIAERLAISANTSKSQLSRARHALRSRLAPGGEQQMRVEQ
jgi:RNA polymerase sigma-70 factor (ECF subfamily)